MGGRQGALNSKTVEALPISWQGNLVNGHKTTLSSTKLTGNKLTVYGNSKKNLELINKIMVKATLTGLKS